MTMWTRNLLIWGRRGFKSSLSCLDKKKIMTGKYHHYLSSSGRLSNKDNFADGTLNYVKEWGTILKGVTTEVKLPVNAVDLEYKTKPDWYCPSGAG